MEKSLVDTPSVHEEHMENAASYVWDIYHAMFDEHDQERVDIPRLIHINTSPPVAFATDPSNSDQLNALSRVFWSRFQRSNELQDIDAAISLGDKALHLTQEIYTNKHVQVRMELGTFHLHRYYHSNDPGDLDKGILMYQQTLKLLPEDHAEADRPHCLQNLGLLLFHKYQRLGELSYLDEAINIQQQCLALFRVDNDSRKVACLNSLGNSFRGRFLKLGEISDIETAISYTKQAGLLSLNDNPHKPGFLQTLGNLCLDKFERSQEVEDLNAALSSHEDALKLTPDNSPHRSSRLSDLGISLLERSKLLDDLGDLNSSISFLQQAIDISSDKDSVKPENLAYLGQALIHRFTRLGDSMDFDRAASIFRQAVELAQDNNMEKPRFLSEYGSALLKVLEYSGRLEDADMAITYHKEAIDLTPSSHWRKPGLMTRLGNSFFSRFQLSQDLADIDEAISWQQEAIDSTHDHFARQYYLVHLGTAFLSRFRRTQDLKDIDQAVQTLEKSADTNAPKDPVHQSMRLSNLGNALLLRFHRSGSMLDLSRAISMTREVLDLIPDDHIDKPLHLGNLGNMFILLSNHTHDVAAINDAITALIQAVNNTPDDRRIVKAELLNNLGMSLVARFIRLHQLPDINMGISSLSRALNLIPDGHAQKCQYLGNLGLAFQHRHSITRHPADLARCITLSQTSAMTTSGPPRLRFANARRSSSLAFLNNYPKEFVLGTSDIIFDLIPRVVWLGRTVVQRYRDIISIDAVALDASIMACSFGRADLGVERLEQGRSIVWGQILQLRAPLDDLKQQHPALASELEQVALELETSSSTTDPSSDSRSMYAVEKALEKTAQAHRRLAERWDALLADVRSRPSFENFLRPKKLLDLLSSAFSFPGPIVMVNINPGSCHALVIHDSSPRIDHIQLASTSHAKLSIAHSALLKVLRSRGARERGDIPEKDEFRLLDENEGLRELLVSFDAQLGLERGSMPYGGPSGGLVGRILRMLWLDIVRPILDCLGYTKSVPTEPLPRITWCLTGPLTFLPLHAAGCYDSDAESTSEKIFHYAVSSYTPSLSALSQPLQDTSSAFKGILAVSQPATPGQSPLPGTVREVIEIQEQFCEKPFTWLNAERATVTAVSRAMEEHDWVHFACHGLQDASDATKSAFALQDGRLNLAAISHMSLKHARFAFLSACQTATGDEKLPEESVHLAAGMLMAGYRTVLATMWSISDRHAPMVAVDVYKQLSKDMETNNGQAAYALHQAIANLREKVGETDFLTWVPFIHLGL